MKLDNLKIINDTYGHKEGDNALRDINSIIKSTFRQSDILARIGGNEFVVFSVGDIDDKTTAAISRFQTNISRQNNIGGRQYDLSVGLGYVICDDFEKSTVETLLEKVDKSMCIQKLLNIQAKQLAW
jgi:diguanylate cyclase (GGDEF)-like protein